MTNKEKNQLETKKLTRREAALENLKKAQAVRRGDIPAKKDWGEKSQARLEKIIERADKELTKAETLEDADPIKLATTLKVCRKELRTIRNESNGTVTVRTHAEAQELIGKLMKDLVASIRKLPTAGQRYFKGELMKAFGD